MNEAERIGVLLDLLHSVDSLQIIATDLRCRVSDDVLTWLECVREVVEVKLAGTPIH